MVVKMYIMYNIINIKQSISSMKGKHLIRSDFFVECVTLVCLLKIQISVKPKTKISQRFFKIINEMDIFLIKNVYCVHILQPNKFTDFLVVKYFPLYDF